MVGRVFRWSASHGKEDKFCVVLVVAHDSGSNWRCLVLDGNHVPAYGAAWPSRTVIWSEYYINQMKRIL